MSRSQPVSASASTHQRSINLLSFIVISIGIIAQLAYPFITDYFAPDLNVFLAAGRGESLEGFFYAPWILPFYHVLASVRYWVAMLIGNIINIAGLWIAARIFGGSRMLLYVSFPVYFAVIYGQIEGMYAGALAVMAWAIQREKRVIASLAWFLAIVKFHVGIPLGIAILWCYAQRWHTRLFIAALVGIYVGLSFVIFPNWLPELLARAALVEPVKDQSIDLYKYFGAIVFVLWIPVLLTRSKNMRWWAATWALTVPYLQIHALIYVLIFPTGWWGWIVQLGYFISPYSLLFMVIVPIIMYLQNAWQAWHQWRHPTDATATPA